MNIIINGANGRMGRRLAQVIALEGVHTTYFVLNGHHIWCPYG